jgi:hypothetical protein
MWHRTLVLPRDDIFIDTADPTASRGSTLEASINIHDVPGDVRRFVAKAAAV